MSPQGQTLHQQLSYQLSLEKHLIFICGHYEGFDERIRDYVDMELSLIHIYGTAKGGIVLSIKDALNIPVKFVGLGEQMDDLQEFDLEQYIYGLCKGLLEK